MSNSSKGGAGGAVLAVLAGVALSVANLIVIIALSSDGGAALEGLRTGDFGPSVQALRALFAASPAIVLVPALGPLLLGILAAIRGGSETKAAPSQPQPEAAPAPKGPPPEDEALRLLALLQHEARLIDFLQEDIGPYDDEQVGAAVREIHAGCKKALAERLTIEKIYEDEDGSNVQVEAGFDPSAIRLTGNVGGEPPFRGVLQHCGWRVTRIDWPRATGSGDAKVLAPAEVEVA